MELINPMTVYAPGSNIHYVYINGSMVPITSENMYSLLEQCGTLEVHTRTVPSEGCTSPMEKISITCSLDDLIRITGIVPQAAPVNLNDRCDNTKKAEPVAAEPLPQISEPAVCTQLAVNPDVPAGSIVRAASFAGGMLGRVEKSNFHSIGNGFVKAKRTQDIPSTLDLAIMLLKKYTIFEYKGALYVFNGKNYDILTADDIKSLCVNEYEPIVPTMKFVTDIAGFVRLKAVKLENINYKLYQSHVVFDNCVYNYLTDTTYPHSDNYFIMHALSIPLVTTSSDCPIFKKFILDMAGGDETLYMRLLETTGYILSNDCFAKRFVALIGPGNTGKSAYGELIKKFFHSKNVTSYSPQALSGQFAGATLSTAALNICMDAPCLPLDPASVAKLKAMTGRDDIQGEIKYLNAFSYIFTGKLLFGLNDDIKITYRDPAFFDRVLYIPCKNIIPRHLRNPYLIEQMQNELPAIARLTLARFAKVVRRNYFFTGDDVYRYSTESVPTSGPLLSTGAYGDTVQEFVAERCTISSEGNLFTPTHILYEAYVDYCKSRKIAALSSSNIFSKRLNSVSPDIFVKKKRFGSTTVNGYYNIALKEQDQSPEIVPNIQSSGLSVQ